LRTVETSVVTFAFFHPQIAAARRLKSICFVQGHSNFLFFSILIADSQADARTHQTRIGFNNASTPYRQSFGHVYTQYHCHPIFTVHAHYFYLSTCAACSCWYAHRDLLIALRFPCNLGRILDRSGFMLFRSSQEKIVVHNQPTSLRPVPRRILSLPISPINQQILRYLFSTCIS
jgi:hypothetical protein